jgi:hypothetical protein
MYRTLVPYFPQVRLEICTLFLRRMIGAALRWIMGRGSPFSMEIECVKMRLNRGSPGLFVNRIIRDHGFVPAGCGDIGRVPYR